MTQFDDDLVADADADAVTPGLLLHQDCCYTSTAVTLALLQEIKERRIRKSTIYEINDDQAVSKQEIR